MILNISSNCEIKCNTLIEKIKRHFYINKIEDHKNSSSDLWKTLKSLGTSSKLKSGFNLYIGLDIDGSTTFDKLKLADTFNECLVG